MAMKDAKGIFTGMSAFVLTLVLVLTGCAGVQVKVVEMDNKGKAIGVKAPEWIKLYVSKGITAVQEQPQFKDKYCIIGEENMTHRSFALAWADNFSAQQRIGAMLRTTISSKYGAAVQASSMSTGNTNSTTGARESSSSYQQEIDNAINAVVNVSYSGAQRDSDWWVLMRRYDPDQKDEYTDEFTAYVLYTIPKTELNRQIARALETSVSKDSVLYDITVALAKDILLSGFEYLAPANDGEDTEKADARAGLQSTGTPVPNGEYIYSPRLREMQGGVDKNGYLDRIAMRGGYFSVFLVDKPAGKGGRPEGDWGSRYNCDYSKIILQNLYNPKQAWNPVKIDTDAVSGGAYLNFETVVGSRFSLTDNNYNPPFVFPEITIGKPGAQ